MRALVAAPCVGEIGWELMSWQGRVRHVFHRGQFDRLVVLGSAGKSGFYADMPLDYRVLDLSALPGSAYEDRRFLAQVNEPMPPEAIRERVAGSVERVVGELRSGGWAVETLWPAYAGRPWLCDDRFQRFIQFQRPAREALPTPWVVLVQRTRGFGMSNWTLADWTRIRDDLHRRGIHTSVFPCESEAAIEALSACDLAMGQSTGGLHLAALCGCPALVWAAASHRWASWELTNRQRYETWWNPLGSLVQVYEVGRLPSPQTAAECVVHALHTIGRRTGSEAGCLAMRVKWWMRTQLARRVIQTRAYATWPWPIQRFVRYQLV